MSGIETSTDAGDSTRRRRLTAEARRELVVAAARQEFAELGYERASLGTIGERAGVTRTVLYRHFPSKRALFVALVEACERGYVHALREAMSPVTGTQERLSAAVDAILSFAKDDRTSWQLLHPAHPPIEPEVVEDLIRIRTNANRLLAGLLAPDAARAGLNPRSSVARAIFALQAGAIQGLVQWWFTHPRVSREDVHTAAMRSLWLGISGMEEPAHEPS